MALRHCRHEWKVTHRSNIIQQDHMGYPLMLCIKKCSKCGMIEQAWIDVPESCLEKLKTGELSLLKWEDISNA